MWTRTPLDEALAWMGVGAALVGLALLVPGVRLPDAGATSLRNAVVAAGRHIEAKVAPRYRATYTDLPYRQTRVEMHDVRAGRKLWSVTTGWIHSKAWSGDRRAFALVADPPRGVASNGLSRLLLWREGSLPAWHDTVRPLKSYDKVAQMEWSPDKRWLLFVSEPMCFSSLRTAWSLDTAEMRPWFLSQYVTRAEWSGEDRVRVWTSKWVKGAEGRAQERKTVSVLGVRSQPQPHPGRYSYGQ